MSSAAGLRLQTLSSTAARMQVLAVLAWTRAAEALVRLSCRLAFRQRRVRPGDPEPLRIAVSRVGNVGDIIVAIPTVSAIRQRFPRAHIVLLTSSGAPGLPSAVDLLAASGLVDDVVTYYRTEIGGWRGWWGLLRRLRAHDFGLFVRLADDQTTTSRELRHLLFARLMGCRAAVGFRAGQARFFLRAQLTGLAQHRVVERTYAAVADDLTLHPPGVPQLKLGEEDRRYARELLAEHGVAGSFVVMHTGAKRETNRWFPDRFASVADAISRELGVQVVLTGSPADRGQVEEVRASMRSESVVLCGDTSLGQLAAVIERASLYVGNDTGPMHLAAAVGTPVVAIFSGRDFPLRWYPAGDGHVVFRGDAACSPCLRETCDRGLSCLASISAGDVSAAVMQRVAPTAAYLASGDHR